MTVSVWPTVTATFFWHAFITQLAHESLRTTKKEVRKTYSKHHRIYKKVKLKIIIVNNVIYRGENDKL